MSELTEQKYRALKSEVETARSDADKAKGALDQLVKVMEDEFGCDSVKAAKKKLEKLKEESEEAGKSFDKALREYEKKWKEREADEEDEVDEDD